MQAPAVQLMTPNEAVADAAVGRPHAGPPGDTVLGLVIVALIPALFWVAMIGGIASALGTAVPPAMLLTIGAAIAMFLSMVGGALLSERS